MSTQGFNRYAYVYNNPTRFTGPSGFFCVGPDAIICVEVIATVLAFIGFGGDDDPPPPEWCKDNTAGCGAVAVNMMENISLDSYVLPLDGEGEDSSEEGETSDQTYDDPVGPRVRKLVKLHNRAIKLLEGFRKALVGCSELYEEPLCANRIAVADAIFSQMLGAAEQDCATNQPNPFTLQCQNNARANDTRRRAASQGGVDDFCGVTACTVRETQGFEDTMELLREINSELRREPNAVPRGQ